MNKNEVNIVVDVDIHTIISEIWKNIILYLVILVVSTASFTIYKKMTYTPSYTSTEKLYIFNNSVTNDGITTNEFSLSTYYARDYVELISDRSVLLEAIEQSGYNIKYETLKRKLNVETPDDTRIIEVSVTYRNPEIAQKLTSLICEVSRQKIVELMGVDRVNVISEAYLPSKSTSLSYLNIAIGGLGIGFIIDIILYCVLHFFNDKISTKNDITNYVGIAFLGEIPYMSEKKHKYRSYGGNKK